MCMYIISLHVFSFFLSPTHGSIHTNTHTHTANVTGNPSLHPDGLLVFVGDEEGGLLAINAMKGKVVCVCVCVCVYVCMCVCVCAF